MASRRRNRKILSKQKPSVAPTPRKKGKQSGESGEQEVAEMSRRAKIQQQEHIHQLKMSQGIERKQRMYDEQHVSKPVLHGKDVYNIILVVPR